MKLSYEQLAVEVDKVYNQNTHESQADDTAIVVSSLIQAGGWTEDEYWERWLNYQDELDKPPAAPYIRQEEVN